ncbi:stage II sporulation protein P [Paenisporosarcina sp. OV554]|uniref:stage II sporulation protein P n=1 Tax=Paenisporosarcina sp. OV554 TaxID=2135694 RepID=UPI000D3DC4E9|nr:stage II sporulation protein P [Paenisporosarcina sp. OV554]PUB10627.1 stage II sporulation protein P [Paenisporosarcina sp. OV554]
MRKDAQLFFGIILLLFLSPMILDAFSSTPQKIVIAEQPEPEENQVMVTASLQNEVPSMIEQTEYKNALLLFTHSHEAFVPIVKSATGQTAVYSPTSNIMGFEDTIKNHFALNFIQTEFLAIDTMDEMKKTNRTFSEAYDVVRPFLAAQVKGKEYDLIIDLHRDSATRNTTTITRNNQSYGKLYFVVGEDHPNFKLNKSLAENLSVQLNEMVPGISRGVIGKKGDNVDGIYNQDLAKNMVLIELGGIENSQEEINRTISVLAKAISIILYNQTSLSSI